MATIMLATKDDELRSYLAQKLKRSGHTVTRVADFNSALTILEEAAFDMLLTSINAADQEDVEFVRNAQDIDPDMRIMFITGFSAIAVRRPDEHQKGDDVLSKPLHLTRLPAEVDNLVAA